MTITKPMNIVLAVLTATLLMACQETPPAAPAPAPVAAPAPPPPPPPPPKPETTLGTLAESLRADEVDLEVLCIGGSSIQADPGAEVFQAAADVCGAKDKARKGHDYIVLRFDGEAKRKLVKEFGKFVATRGAGNLARVDEESWLTDAEGKKYEPAYAKSIKTPRQLAFEVPESATGLVFHDGKDRSHPLSFAGAK